MDQARIKANAVDVVIQFAVLADDAVLHLRIGIRIGVGRRNGRVRHLAFRIEVVEPGRQQIIGLANPITLAGNHFAGTVYIVIVSINLDQARIKANAVDVVIQFAVFIHNAIL